MTAAEKLLDRMEKAKRTGVDRWLARCPAHQDKSPSLSIRELPDGRLLLHCWAGCDTEAVLSAVGLTFSDLFPEPAAGHAPRVRRAFSAADALLALDFETTVVCIAAADLAAGKPINRERLLLAAKRISSAMEAVHG